MKNRFLLYCFVITIISMVAMPAYANNGDIDKGISWLLNNQNVDGSWECKLNCVPAP